MTETTTEPVIIPEDVRDNSETVTDYAFMGHRSPNRGVVSPGARDRTIDMAVRFLTGYQHYTWLDVNQGDRLGRDAGHRCRFDMIVNRDGQVVNLFHTEYWTRVACYQGEWCSSYATHYVTTTGGTLPVSDPVPVCDHHIDGLRKSFADSPVTLNLSEPLLIGQHD